MWIPVVFMLFSPLLVEPMRTTSLPSRLSIHLCFLDFIIFFLSFFDLRSRHFVQCLVYYCTFSYLQMNRMKFKFHYSGVNFTRFMRLCTKYSFLDFFFIMLWFTCSKLKFGMLFSIVFLQMKLSFVTVEWFLQDLWYSSEYMQFSWHFPSVLT